MSLRAIFNLLIIGLSILSLMGEARQEVRADRNRRHQRRKKRRR